MIYSSESSSWEVLVFAFLHLIFTVFTRQVVLTSVQSTTLEMQHFLKDFSIILLEIFSHALAAQYGLPNFTSIS